MGQGEGAEGLPPALDGGAFDEAAGGAHTIAAARAALAVAGVTVIDRPAPDSPAVWVERLHHDGKPLDVEGHQSCPGHAACVGTDSWSDRLSTTYVCTDPAARGHVNPYASTGPAVGERGGPMTEKQKAERRQLIASNKAMVAATEVRREFVRGLLARRTAPKGTLRYVTDVLTGADSRWMLVR